MTRLIALSLAGCLLCGTANAAPCFSSAAAVRKAYLKAWPKWTYDPHGGRCWYAGEKPVFTRAPPEPPNRPETQPTPAATPETVGRSSGAPARLPWQLEYRWAIEEPQFE